MAKRIAIYARVSTQDQTTENQLRELRAWADRAGYDVVAEFEEKVSGAKSREKRPQLDNMLKAASRREFDMLAVWSTDRLGRSLQDLLDCMKALNGLGCGLHIHTQGFDTTTPAGKMMYQVLGAIAEFERELIVSRVNAGIARAKENGTKSGKAIGRPRKGKATDTQIQAQLATGTGILKTAKLLNCGTGTVNRVAKAMRI